MIGVGKGGEGGSATEFRASEISFFPENPPSLLQPTHT